MRTTLEVALKEKGLQNLKSEGIVLSEVKKDVDMRFGKTFPNLFTLIGVIGKNAIVKGFDLNPIPQTIEVSKLVVFE